MIVAATNATVQSTTGARMDRPTVRTWKEIVRPVEPFLDKVVEQLSAQVSTFVPEIAPLAEYALNTQGKHLRPALVSLSADLPRGSGESEDDLVTIAVIIEMVHLATLVHDDIMDKAAIRRRRPTMSASWGNQISVLLGDCLFAHALRLASGFPTTEVCRAVSATTHTVCSGEILQTLRKGNFELSLEDYFQVLEMKTAALFALACELGASHSGATSAERRALRDYGLRLGTAYQIYDDCVDLFGTESRVGKSLGTDLAGGKLTLPVLVVRDRADEADRAKLRGLVDNWEPERAGELGELLGRYGAIDECRRAVNDRLALARAALAPFEDGGSRAALDGLTEFLAQQTESLGVSS